MNENPRERRRLTRHPIQAPVVLANGASGMTTDISASGIRFECAEVIPEGSVVDLELTLGESQSTLHCSGIVLRTEIREGKMFVAAVIDRIVFAAPPSEPRM